MNSNNINLSVIKHDLFGGLTAAVVALPLALAFGVSSGLGALSGLYGAIFVGFFASFFGGTPKQISGPTGPMTVIVGIIFIEFNYRPEPVFFCILLSGVFQILFGIIKLGSIVKYIPMPVVSGFMTGIGLIIIFLQLPVLLGLGNEATVILSLAKLTNFFSFNKEAWIIGSLCLLGLFLIPSKINKIIPTPIIILFLGTLTAFFFFNDLKLIGLIPSGIPKMILFLPEIHELLKIITYAFLLALLGIIDSLLTSIIADRITNDVHKPNKEIIGQGVGNFLSGLFGGLAGAGATMRTVVNIKAGGKTKFSGITHSILLLLIVLVFSPIAEIIPLSVLAAILIKVGVDIIDWDFVKKFSTQPIRDRCITFFVIVLTVFVNLIVAVILGALLYFFLNYFFIKNYK